MPYLWQSWPVSSQSQASFFVPFNSLVILTIRSDVYILRSGDFRAKLITLPLTHVCGIKIAKERN